MLPPLDPSHPLNQAPQHFSGIPSHPAAQESGRVFMPAAVPPQIDQAGPPIFDHAAALQQLATLQIFDHATQEARRLGGPTAALSALMARPIAVGGFELRPATIAVFWFLQIIDSPFVNGGEGDFADISKALLAFTAPEQTARYLSFTPTAVTVDQAALTRDAWQLAATLSTADLAAATQWITGQIGGLAALFPAGEEAGNFPIAGTATASPPASNPPPVPPAGSLSSSIS